MGTRKDWVENRKRPYQERRNILKEDLGCGVGFRLCEETTSSKEGVAIDSLLDCSTMDGTSPVR